MCVCVGNFFHLFLVEKLCIFYPLKKESKAERSSLPEAIPSQILALIVAYEARDRHRSEIRAATHVDTVLMVDLDTKKKL